MNGATVGLRGSRRTGRMICAAIRGITSNCVGKAPGGRTARSYVVRTKRMTVRFDWDSHKNRTNISKHGVGFAEAARVFSDPFVLIGEDRIIEGDERFHAIGYVDNLLLLVVHTIKRRRPQRDDPHHFSAPGDGCREDAL